jgi:hypothetical protein
MLFTPRGFPLLPGRLPDLAVPPIALTAQHLVLRQLSLQTAWFYLMPC